MRQRRPASPHGRAAQTPNALSGAGLALLLWLSAACTRSQPPTADAWRDWLARDAHGAEVMAYAAYLRDAGVGEVVPMSALLRSSRRWRVCGHDAWAVPPRALWPELLPTLRLIARIETDTGIRLDAVRSGWRSEAVNRCARGAARSRHLQNLALDIDLATSPPAATAHAAGGSGANSTMTLICGFWRRHGAQASMGLGFYSPTHIHIDTAGFRTWGSDHRRGTSLCVSNM